MQEIWRMLAYYRCRFLLRLDNTYELFLCAVLDIEQNPVTLEEFNVLSGAGTIKLTPWNIRTNVGQEVVVAISDFFGKGQYWCSIGHGIIKFL